MSETETSALEELLRPLADGTRAEFLAELRKLSLHQDDDELFKLLKILSIYAEFYQTIPTAIREAHNEAISRIEALVATTTSGAVGHQDDRIAPLLDELAAASATLRGSVPPSFEEFRSTIERIHDSAGRIDRFSRELILELQKVLARRSSTETECRIFFTASISSIIGAVTIYVLLRYLPI